MTKQELGHVLMLHEMWLNHENRGVRADLRGENLQNADLHDVNLQGADLSGADLSGADLYKADLGGAKLYESDLIGANMQRVCLWGADLRGANLKGADLGIADMWEANLERADLKEANLSRSNLWEAKIRRADLQLANLKECIMSECDMWEANLNGAKNVPFLPLACPERGEFVAFKKCNDYIIELLIPADAKRCSATTRKCRASHAKVLSITTLSGESSKVDSVTNSGSLGGLVYKVGEFVYVDKFDDNRWNNHGKGIWFFINREDAVIY